MCYNHLKFYLSLSNSFLLAANPFGFTQAQHSGVTDFFYNHREKSIKLVIKSMMSPAQAL